MFLDVYFTSQNTKREIALKTFYSELDDVNCSDIETAENGKADFKTPTYLASLLTDPAPSITIDNKDLCPPRKTLAETTQSSHLYRLREFDVHTDDNPCNAYNGTTAAYDMYTQWCRRQTQLTADSCTHLNPPTRDQILYLQWGFSPDQTFYSKLLDNQTSAHQCVNSTSTLNALYYSIKLTLLAAGGSPSKTQKLCPYNNFIGARYIHMAPPAHLKELLEDKIVLIGVSNNSIPDRIESSVQGHLPGIFWHAAALDNLMQRGNRFIRERNTDYQAAIESLVACLIFFILAVFVHKNSKTQQQADMFAKQYG